MSLALISVLGMICVILCGLAMALLDAAERIVGAIDRASDAFTCRGRK